jgi:GTP-binding protein YchF
MESELILADMQLLQNRIEKINKERKARPQKEEDPELLLLERLAQALEEGKVVKDLKLGQDELKMLSGFQLFTLKPVIVVANVSEKQLKEQDYRELEQKAREKNLKFLSLCAKLEAEIEELPEEERPEFLKEMGLPNLSSDKFIQICFQAMERILFFTVVGKEARAWPISRGTTALEAAGSVHSDMERGFIRAEVINYKNFVECGSFAKAKEKGLLRLESKEYPVQDGDIINFKFSV